MPNLQTAEALTLGAEWQHFLEHCGAKPEDAV